MGKRELLSFYDRHLNHFGDSPQSLRWTEEGQRRRYEMLVDIAGDISGKHVLDFGCGKGDFYGFMKKEGLTVRYTGIDINENFLALAREKHPDGHFITADVEERELRETFDIVFVCGVFNLRVGGVAATMKNVLKRLFGHTRESMHINALSSFTPSRDVELFHSRPEELLTFALRELSSALILRHGLIEGDLFLSVYRSSVVGRY